MNLADSLIDLGHQLESERNAAHDLWTWLPSHQVAKHYHGDYADMVCPSPRDVMVEAAMFQASLVDPYRDLTAEEKMWFERCPCGEDHVESEGAT